MSDFLFNPLSPSVRAPYGGPPVGPPKVVAPAFESVDGIVRVTAREVRRAPDEMVGMFDGVTADRLHRHGRAAMGALLTGNRFKCRRALADLSRRSIPFEGLELVAQGMAQSCGAAFADHARELRPVIRSLLDRIEAVVVAASFYARCAASAPQLVRAEAEHMIATGRSRWISDLVGARVVPALVGADPREAWRGLAPWAEAEDPWRRRAIAAGANRVLCDPRSDTQHPLRLLAALRGDDSNDVRGVVAQALRTLSRHHRKVALDTLHAWAHQADDRTATVVRGGMTGLGPSDRRRLEAVLATR